MLEQIKIKGARVHNLKNVDLSLPRNKLVVFTGLSGSGKSSLAFDTIYAEGRRRYMESLSSYARQFLGQMDKPEVDYIEGLSPAISIDQKTTSHNPRSTVGTVTEIYDYLRLLFARIGVPHCPQCGREIARQTVQQMVDQLLKWPEGTRLQILAPVVKGKKGEFVKLLEEIRRDGFSRLRIDGEVRDLSEEIKLNKNKKHNMEIIVDRLVIRESNRNRLASSLETTLHYGGGLALVWLEDQEILFSENFACPECGLSLPDLEPRLFSFNNPFGACPECTGLGMKLKLDPDLLLPRPRLSLAEGAVRGCGGQFYGYLEKLAERLNFSLQTPFEELPAEIQQIVFYGQGSKNEADFFEGAIPYLNRRYRETTSDFIRRELEHYMTSLVCPVCQGRRLRPEALAILIGGKSIWEVNALSVVECLDFFNKTNFTERQQLIGQQILKEIRTRLGFLLDVGLDYLTLDRMAGTLSGGESQRIRLATQIGSGLMGVLYILDEPSIGLHQRDNQLLLRTLFRLRDLGNTLIVVEHDEETIRAADLVVDIGPGAGEHGGQIVACGTAEELSQIPASLTGQFLSGRRFIPVPAVRRPLSEKKVQVLGASANNLQEIDVDFPLQVFIGVTGVSGSGKSSLVNEVLARRLLSELNRAKVKAGSCRDIKGLEYLDKVIEVDQSPIGRTPRSNPATYTGVFNDIRELFAQTAEARVRGYKPGRFSFNVKGGRCEACQGDGILKIEMHFLPDVYVPCEVCKGQRYNRETLEIRYKGRNIAEILQMTVEEALEFFSALPKIKRKLQALEDVGLGYMRLGQPAPELSGGEAQRVKLAAELARRSNGRTMYILDEPTTGLHIADVERLLVILHRLVEAGNTVVVIEHNLDVIKTADYLIDLGPEGGWRGGQVVACGRPEEIVEAAASYTGKFLKPVLAQGIYRS